MKTKVIFRYWDNDIIAIFPEIPANSDVCECSSYMHFGQHSACEPWHIIGHSRPATKEEYGDLKAELEECVGYDLQVIKRYRHSFIQERLKCA